MSAAPGENVPYPQSERLSEFSSEYQAIHEFLDHLGSEGIWLARYMDIGWRDEQLLPNAEQHEIVVLRFLGVDPVALELERRAMLAALQARKTWAT